jgi:hypothetical protein
MARQNDFVPALLFLGALLASPAKPANSDEYEPRVGEPFPRLVLPSLEDGSPLSVASFGRKKLVLHIWASW